MLLLLCEEMWQPGGKSTRGALSTRAVPGCLRTLLTRPSQSRILTEAPGFPASAATLLIQRVLCPSLSVTPWGWHLQDGWACQLRQLFVDLPFRRRSTVAAFGGEKLVLFLPDDVW